MLEIIGFGFGGVATLTTVFMVGQKLASGNKYVTKVDFEKCRDSSKKDGSEMHKKVNKIGECVARIEGTLEEMNRSKNNG